MKSIILAIILAFSSTLTYAADTKPMPKIDCALKKNEKKPQCQKAPTSNVKPEIKAPPKVDRKAPASVQKKAAEENAKK